MAIEALWVIGAALVNFALAGIWYVVFGKQWRTAWNLPKSRVEEKDPKPYLVAFIGYLWASYGVFLIVKHIQPQSLIESLTIGVGCWLFIQVGMGAKHYSMARVNGKAFAIDYGLDLISFVIIVLMVN